MANTLNEGRHAAEFMVSEANGARSRDVVVIAEGHKLGAGTIIGMAAGASEFEPFSGTPDKTAILYDNVDTTDGAKEATAVTRDAEVVFDALAVPDDATDADKQSIVNALDKVGIRCSNSHKSRFMPTGVDAENDPDDDASDDGTTGSGAAGSTGG